MVASLTGLGTDRLVGVSRLFVSPAARGLGLGLGAPLLAALSSWAWAHDLRLMLDVVDDGAPAIRLYQRMGWRLVDRRQADSVPSARSTAYATELHASPSVAETTCNGKANEIYVHVSAK